MRMLNVLNWVSTIVTFLGASLLLLTIWPTLSSEVWYWGSRFQQYRVDGSEGKSDPKVGSFATLVNSPTPLQVDPVSSEFGIVIEKIGVNAPVVEDVSVANPVVYQEALGRGVAHALGSAKPGEFGNIYLFAHSSLNFWQLGKYATVFNLLRKLEVGDAIVLFYNEKRFDFQVTEVAVVSGFDLSPLVTQDPWATLTLQTCYPPGSTLNRLIVRATVKYP